MTDTKINPEVFQSSANKTVLITGAAHGIGLATTKQFNKHGANIILADLSHYQERAEILIRDEFSYPEQAIFAKGNVTDWDELQGCFKRGIERFGGIDIVIANAGIMESKSVFDFDVDPTTGNLKGGLEGERVFDVNLKGTLNTLRLAMYYLSLKAEQPISTESTHHHNSSRSIILIGSSSSYFGGTGVAAYVASKHGVLGLLRASQARATELGIRINGVAPFLTPTRITAGFADRWRERGLEENTPERVAEAVAFLALDGERSGECFLVAGRFLREMEKSRTNLIPTWLGEDLAGFLATAMQFFVSIGGYVLPKKY